MIKSLQSLRGIAAIMIVAHHFGFQSGMVDSFGDCAVAIFMMLSGFVLSLAYHDRVAEGYDIAFRNFMLKRIVRIFPLYLLGQLYILALYRFRINPATLIPDLLMLQSWIPSPTYYFSGNSPTWFVSDLMLCYLLFIPTITLINRKPRLFASIFAVYLIAYVCCATFIPEELVHPIVYIFPPMQFPVFVFGMLLAKRYGTQRCPKGGAAVNLIIAGVIMLTIAQMWFYTSVTPRLSLSSYWWIAAALLIVVLTVFDNVRCAMMRLLHLPALISLGDISYALYIFHIPFLYTWRILCRHLGLTLTLSVDFIIFTAAAIIGASLINRMIERPLTKRLDSMLIRKPS